MPLYFLMSTISLNLSLKINFQFSEGTLHTNLINKKGAEHVHLLLCFARKIHLFSPQVTLTYINIKISPVYYIKCSAGLIFSFKF